MMNLKRLLKLRTDADLFFKIGANAIDLVNELLNQH